MAISRTSIPQTLPSGYSFDMIFVKGGTFRMRTHEIKPEDTTMTPLVKVKDFLIGRYPVTQGLWKAVMGEDQNPSFFRGDDRPVESIGNPSEEEFLAKLRSSLGKDYHLPTEIQWEYAAKGGIYQQGTIFAGSNSLNEVAWFLENSHGETKPVGLKYPNELGIFDMVGNVWEPCRQWFDKNYLEYWDGHSVIEEDAGKRNDVVLRSGGWDAPARYCNPFWAGRDDAYASSSGIGMRLVINLF